MELNRGLGVISSNFFSLIDPLLNVLSKSGYGCHIRGVYSGVLYADDINNVSKYWWFKFNVENI